MKKKILCILFVLSVVVGAFASSAFAEEAVNFSDGSWTELSADYLNSVNYELPSGKYYLKNDVTTTKSITTKKNADVTLDLNGNVLKLDAETGSVIAIKIEIESFTDTDSKKFTLQDNNPTKEHKFDTTNEVWTLVSNDATGDKIKSVYGGVITAGKGYDVSDIKTYGGGIYVQDVKTIELKGGNVVGCTASYGGGLYAISGNLYLKGVNIMGCGNDELWNTSTAYMSGGNISGSVYNGRNWYMSGGTITGKFVNDGNIYSGTFDCEVENRFEYAESYKYIYGGTFKNKVTNSSWISDGIFLGEVDNDSAGIIDGGDFSNATKLTNVYSVTFDAKGGSPAPQTQYRYNAKANMPDDNPTKTEFAFDGWFDEEGNEYEFNENVESNIKLTAHWESLYPVFNGIETSKTYCGDVKFKISDRYGLTSVKLFKSAAEEELTSDSDGYYTIKAGTGYCRVEATNTTGRSTDVFITVNSDHVYNWKKDETHYWKQCDNCGDVIESSKKPLPTADITISGEDKVCKSNKYVYSFTLPSGCKSANGYITGDGMSLAGDEASVVIEGNTVTVSVDISTYGDIDYFYPVALIILEDDYPIEITGNKVDIVPHTGSIIHVDAKEATTDTEGNTEYWYCEDCKICYEDKELTKVISKENTVIAKISTPKTGDNSKIVLWGMILVVCAVIVCILVKYRKKKN